MRSISRVGHLLERSKQFQAFARMTSTTAPVDIAHPLSYNHRDGKKFFNPWPSSALGNQKGLGSVITAFTTDFEHGRAKPSALPLQDPDWNLIASPPPDKLVVTWIGHASFLVQVNGLNILTDPVYSERCSLTQLVGPKRYMPVPGGSLEALINKLPKIDAVVLSHNHYDHLDKHSVQSLSDGPTWFVPTNVASVVRDFGVSQIVELDWWQSTTFTRTSPSPASATFACLPCQHFSNRGLFDRNETLWASWAIVFPEVPGRPVTKVWFAGDTGYRDVPRGFKGDEKSLDVCPAFQEIGEVIGPFDLALIPIGAYSPRWFMSTVHLNPEDAVAVHLDVKSKRSVGMHWGTFILTDEPTDEPPKRLKAEIERRGLPEDSFTTMIHGETRVIDL
eukprot:c5000_g1_i1.p1 GENE.c5000_g1_i1~~c5000_g1_i1.p1  ORF type:complete len:391 (+),score=68.96 c5000_g1_i1:215-1387(+)